MSIDVVRRRKITSAVVIGLSLVGVGVCFSFQLSYVTATLASTFAGILSLGVAGLILAPTFATAGSSIFRQRAAGHASPSTDTHPSILANEPGANVTAGHRQADFNDIEAGGGGGGGGGAEKKPIPQEKKEGQFWFLSFLKKRIWPEVKTLRINYLFRRVLHEVFILRTSRGMKLKPPKPEDLFAKIDEQFEKNRDKALGDCKPEEKEFFTERMTDAEKDAYREAFDRKFAKITRVKAATTVPVISSVAFAPVSSGTAGPAAGGEPVSPDCK